MTDDPTSPAAVVLRYLDAFAVGDPDAIAALVSDDFVNEHLSALGAGSRGRDEYRHRLPDFLAMFQGLRYGVEAISALDRADEVVVRYRLTATYDDQPVDIVGVMWFVVREGKVARRTDVWDSLTFLRQTGQAP